LSDEPVAAEKGPVSGFAEDAAWRIYSRESKIQRKVERRQEEEFNNHSFKSEGRLETGGKACLKTLGNGTWKIVLIRASPVAKAVKK
jgi:hypothetical protein